MPNQTENKNAHIKITRAGYLYIDGYKKGNRVSNSVIVSDKLNPFTLISYLQLYHFAEKELRGWVAKNYVMI